MECQPLPIATFGIVTAMGALQRLSAAVNAYIGNPDPRVALANSVSVLVASNQPFYPLYLWWFVGGNITPAFYTFLSTPFFLAVPAIARVNSAAGRGLLPVTGIANTLLCARLFGVQSGVEIFLIPCAVLALLIFRSRERILSLALAGACFAAFLFLHGRYGEPVVSSSADEYAALVRLNVMSASALTALVAIMFSRLLAECEVSAKATGSEKAR